MSSMYQRIHTTVIKTIKMSMANHDRWPELRSGEGQVGTTGCGFDFYSRKWNDNWFGSATHHAMPPEIDV